MSQSRRDFVKSVSVAAMALAPGRERIAPRFQRLDSHPRAGDPVLRDLATHALDAARGAGAVYADVRLTLTRTETIGVSGSVQWTMQTNDEHGAIGVRALVDGAWGFAASPLWTVEETARLGREAAVQAANNAKGRKRRIDLGDPPPVVTGEWTRAVRYDPFLVPLSEKLEVIWALAEAATRVNAPVDIDTYTSVQHRRQDKTFASSLGSFLSQTMYLSNPGVTVFAADDKGRVQSRSLDGLLPSAAGWEAMTSHSLAALIPETVEEAVRKLDSTFITPNRYDIVFDALATAQIVARTLGVAAELDRALGYEANAGGTSYLAPANEVLGKLALGPSFLNVSGNRSRNGSPGTVKWDDEGVAPAEYSVVKDGVFAGYHTNRELAAELKGSSRGCASSENGIGITMVQPPNIEMLPGPGDTALQDLVAGLDYGLVVLGGSSAAGSSGGLTIDRQQLNGEIVGNTVYEVRKGKRVGYIKNAEVLFRSPELWKSLKAIGGRRSQVWTAATVSKGQPSQQVTFGVGAVPALFTRVAVTDVTRKT